MGCTSAFPLPLVQKNINASLRKMIDPKIAKKLVKSKQNYFHILKTSKGQNQQAQSKIGKIQIENENQQANYSQMNIKLETLIC